MRVRKGIGKCLEEENERTKDVIQLKSQKLEEITLESQWKTC